MLFGRNTKNPIKIAVKGVKEWRYTTRSYCSTGSSIEVGLNVADITEWRKPVTLWNTRIRQLIRNRLRGVGHIEVISLRFAKQSGLPAEKISPLIRRPGTTVLQDSCIYF